jgi:phosphatidylinositol-3,4,5-trisphosphate 3-phosphatase/dual-specificity protein phosphatase PTEN
MSRKKFQDDDDVPPPPPSYPPPESTSPTRKAPAPSSKSPKSPARALGKDEKHSSSSHLTDGLRKMVSQKKNRFQEDGFDLDLTYISDRIIAMGFPSTGAEGVYRNPMDEVKQFFQKYHDKHFKVYNLCSERTYEAKEFESLGGKAVHYPFDDHNPPPLSLIPKICEDASDFMKKDKKNVVAIHCKAGKGRTGCIIACLLCHLKQAADAKEALDIFGANRTSNRKGVTIPSQKRYVGYYDTWLKQSSKLGKRVEPKPTITITGFHLQGKAPDFDVSGGCDPFCRVEILNDQNELQKVYDQKKDKTSKIPNWKEQKEIKVSIKGLAVSGNVKVVFKDADVVKDDNMFAFFIHTGFVSPPSMVFAKKDLDKAFKNKEFPDDFKITMFFEAGGTASPSRKPPSAPGKK